MGNYRRALISAGMTLKNEALVALALDLAQGRQSATSSSPWSCLPKLPRPHTQALMPVPIADAVGPVPLKDPLLNA